MFFIIILVIVDSFPINPFSFWNPDNLAEVGMWRCREVVVGIACMLRGHFFFCIGCMVFPPRFFSFWTAKTQAEVGMWRYQKVVVGIASMLFYRYLKLFLATRVRAVVRISAGHFKIDICVFCIIISVCLSAAKIYNINNPTHV